MMNIKARFALACPAMASNSSWVSINRWNVFVTLSFDGEAKCFELKARPVSQTCTFLVKEKD
ncbi:hypothetical protein ACF8O8_08920 [Pseudomonas sp. TYF_14]